MYNNDTSPERPSCRARYEILLRPGEGRPRMQSVHALVRLRRIRLEPVFLVVSLGEARQFGLVGHPFRRAFENHRLIPALEMDHYLGASSEVSALHRLRVG